MMSKQRARVRAAEAIGAAFLSLALTVQAWAQNPSLQSVAPKSQASLISSGGLRTGEYLAGLDIALAPGVLTYWRFPGDAGVPPDFAFTGSENLAKAQVAFPAPRRIVEAGETTFGYLNDVLFPIAVTPVDASRPTRLDVTVHYATCDTICVPTETQQTITLSPSDPSSPDAARIAAWRNQVPTPLPAALAPRIDLLAGGPKATWRVAFHQTVDKGADLFVEGPDGWFFDSKPMGAGAFQIGLVQTPDGVRPGAVPATLTFVDGAHAYETRVSLDAAGR
jgi:DsbC/DsbD-like thiol-disulfide interchange protein